jgi:hypothetical protein
MHLASEQQYPGFPISGQSEVRIWCMSMLSIAGADAISGNMLELMGSYVPTATRSSPYRPSIKITGMPRPRPARALIVVENPACSNVSLCHLRLFLTTSNSRTKGFLTMMHGSTVTRFSIQIGSTMKASRVHVSLNATRCLTLLTSCSLHGKHQKEAVDSGS